MLLRKFISTVTTIALTTTLFSSIALADSPKNENAKKSLVSLGDSITYGMNLDNNHHPSKHAFPQLIADSENVRVTNLAKSGWTTTDLLQSLETPRYQEAIKKADYITLNIGSNDFLQIAKEYLLSMGTTPIDQQKLAAAYLQVNQNLPKIVNQIQELTSAPIVLYTFYNPAPQDLNQIRFVVDSILEGNAPMGLLPPNQLIRHIATEFDQVVLADSHQHFTAEYVPYLIRLADNDIHPTEAGQELLAQLALAALAE